MPPPCFCNWKPPSENWPLNVPMAEPVTEMIEFEPRTTLPAQLAWLALLILRAPLFAAVPTPLSVSVCPLDPNVGVPVAQLRLAI